MGYEIIVGDVLHSLRTLPEESVQCVVTSPPYFGLRDYGMPGQIGLEATPQEFVAKLVEVFREVRRVLRSDGTCWLNLGDSYAGSWGAQSRGNTTGEAKSRLSGSSMLSARQIEAHPLRATSTGSLKNTPGLKKKDLMGIPWRLAFALQDDGWWLRQDLIWAKLNPMPESVTDRCTKAHEYVFMLTKAARYFYDANAIKENCVRGDAASSYTNGKTATHQLGRAGNTRKTKVPGGWDTEVGGHGTIHRKGRTEAEYVEAEVDGRRNKRSVWNIATEAYAEAHFATFPTKLVEPCILAGSKIGDTILDPFSGSGTTGVVAQRHGRDYIGIELNPEYAEMSRRRLDRYWDAPLPKQTDDHGPLFSQPTIAP